MSYDRRAAWRDSPIILDSKRVRGEDVRAALMNDPSIRALFNKHRTARVEFGKPERDGEIASFRVDFDPNVWLVGGLIAKYGGREGASAIVTFQVRYMIAF